MSAQPIRVEKAEAHSPAELECPLCRKTFDGDNMACHRGCPMSGHCGALCCPHCGYEFVDTRKVESRFQGLRSLFHRFRREQRNPGSSKDAGALGGKS